MRWYCVGMNTSPLRKAVEIIGGQVALAESVRDWHRRHGNEVRVAQGHVWNWLNTTKTPMPPAEHCRAIEEATAGQVTRYDLRPDVYGTDPARQAA